MLNVTERDMIINIIFFSTVPLCFLSIKARISLGLLTSIANAGGDEGLGRGCSLGSERRSAKLLLYYYLHLRL